MDQLLMLQEELSRRAREDALTAVLNRGAILEALEREVGRAWCGCKQVGLALIDLDYFQGRNISVTLSLGRG